jgi:hypothetical protein
MQQKKPARNSAGGLHGSYLGIPEKSNQPGSLL